MNYFNGSENAGFGMEKQASGACSCGFLGAGRTENPVRAWKRRGPDHGSWMCGLVWPARARCFKNLASRPPDPTSLVWPARARCFWVEGRRDLVISFFSPRIRADMSAALVDTEEN